jgi:NitT/TauT family transport system substrate-binding protein
MPAPASPNSSAPLIRTFEMNNGRPSAARGAIKVAAWMRVTLSPAPRLTWCRAFIILFFGFSASVLPAHAINRQDRVSSHQPVGSNAMKISVPTRYKLLAAISLASVCFAALPATNAAAQDLIKVKVGDTTSLAQLGMYAGIQKGIFKKHGIDIERIAIPGGSKVLTTLLSGDIDIGYLASSTSLQAQFQDRPVKIIGMSHNMEIYSLLGRNEFKGKIKQPSDLKGHTIGISAIGSGSWAFAKFLAHYGKLDAARDVKIVPLGNMMAIIAALKTDRVDTVTLWEPGTTMALKENAGYAVVDLLDPAQHQKYVSSPHSMVEVILAKEDLIKTKKDMLRKFFAAQNEAYDWLHKTPMEEVAKAVAPIVGESNMDVLVAALKRNLGGVPTVATVDEATFNVTMKNLVETGIFKEPIPFSKSVDNSFAASR